MVSREYLTVCARRLRSRMECRTIEKDFIGYFVGYFQNRLAKE